MEREGLAPARPPVPWGLMLVAACALGTAASGAEGAPRAPRGGLVCDGHAVDPHGDAQHCGGCGHVCPQGAVCSRGLCTSQTPSPGPSTYSLPQGTWYARGPYVGGRLDGIVASPTSASSLFVASPGGGVWSTTTNGASWARPGTYGLGDYSMLTLAWDRVRPGRLLAAAWNTLYASTDNGATWSAIVNTGSMPGALLPYDHPTDPRPFAQLKLSSTQSYILYSYGCMGLFYSADGTNFSQTFPFSGGSSNVENCIQSITADDNTGYVYFSTMGTGSDPAHVYRSTCAWTASSPCLSWSGIGSGLPTGVVGSSLVYTGYSDNLAAVMNNARGSSTSQAYTYWGPPGTYCSNYWCPTATFPDVSWDARTIDYPGLNQLFVGAVVPYQTVDYGSTWTEFGISGQHPDTRAFYWDNSLGYLWATTDGAMGGNYANIVRWSWSVGVAPTNGVSIPVTGSSGLPVWQAYYLAATQASNASGARLFLGTQDNAGMCSDDRGQTWTTSGAGSVDAGDWISMVFAPSNPNRAYLRSDGSVFGRTDNAGSATSCAGVTWTQVTPTGGIGTPSIWTRAMTAVHPTNPDRVYFVRLNDIGISTNAGATLTASTPPPSQPVSIYVDASGIIYIGTRGGGAYRSTDNGVTWIAWGLNASPPVAVMNIAYSSANGGTWFLATTSGLYRLIPGGSWALVTGGGGYVVDDVEVDPTCPTRVYAAFGYGFTYTLHRGGIQVSSDGGSTWTSITAGQNLHQGPVSDIQVDPGTSRYLYAASYGQGGWVYDLGVTPSCP